MSFPAEKKNQWAFDDPMIRFYCWMRANDCRVWLELLLYTMRYVEQSTATNAPFPQWLKDSFTKNPMTRIVQDYVYLQRVMYGQSAADAEVRKINEAILTGLSGGAADRGAYEAHRPWSDRPVLSDFH